MTAAGFCSLLLMLAGGSATAEDSPATEAGSAAAPDVSGSVFSDDLAFLRRYTNVIVLTDETNRAQVAIVPAWQGRVMTSTAEYEHGRSFGWINRQLIASGKLAENINAFGGEDRVWLGPEGGQFALFFAGGAPFSIDHWFVPKELDTRPFNTVSKSRRHASFHSEFALTNYSGTRFQVEITREVHLLDNETAWQHLGVAPGQGASLVAFESRNVLTNAGKEPWKKETGLLSIWILGMFAPSPSTTIVVPIKRGPAVQLGPRVTSDYFGVVPPGRLTVTEEAIFFRGDGMFRSKIGISARRSLAKLGSYDPVHGVLTVVLFSQPHGTVDYVNSLWKYQEDPYAGDAVNSYNDGPAAPGAQALGPFYELESSSPAAALAPGESLKHTHRTFHLIGPVSKLDEVSRTVLGLSLTKVTMSIDTH